MTTLSQERAFLQDRGRRQNLIHVHSHGGGPLIVLFVTTIVFKLALQYNSSLASFRIPLERGRDIAIQYGVAPLLAPLFDFVPNTNAIGALPPGMPNITGTNSPRPLSAASSFSSLGASGNFGPAGLAPPPIMPGSALRLLNQGRAQGLFTPSTSNMALSRAHTYPSPGPYFSGNYPPSPFQSLPGVSPTPPPIGQPSLKRMRSDVEPDASLTQSSSQSMPTPTPLAASPEIQMTDRPPSTSTQLDEGPSPTKRARIEPQPPDSDAPNDALPNDSSTSFSRLPTEGSASQSMPQVNGVSRPASTQSAMPNGKLPNEREPEHFNPRLASKPSIPRAMDPSAPARDLRRTAIIAAICQHDDPGPILDLLRDIAPDTPSLEMDVDLVLDDQGHTALHLAASMARHMIVEALITSGADVHRGNYNGETPLMRACLATNNADEQSFHLLVAALHPSVRTLDTSRKSVLHHIVASAGVKGRATAARYYLDQIFLWVAQSEGGDFASLVDLQDEHGDTALNVAARVGNRSLVRTFLDVGANRILPNKLGMRPGDFGVETEVGDLFIKFQNFFLIVFHSGTRWWPSRRRYIVFSAIRTVRTRLEEPGCVNGYVINSPYQKTGLINCLPQI